MGHKNLLRLLILFLGFSYVLSSRAVPLSASLESVNEDSSVQEFVEQICNKEVLELEEGFIRGRMDIASNDYQGAGANNHHDPKTPGRGLI